MDLKAQAISKDFITKYFIFGIGVICLSAWYYFKSAEIFLYYGILVNIALIYRVRNSKILQIMFLFILTYTLNLLPYFSFGINITFYERFQKEDIFEFAMFLHVLFLLVLYLFLKKDINKNKEIFINRLPNKDNAIVYGLGVFAMSVILIIGQTGHRLVEGQGFQLTQGLAINEYFLIFTALAYLFSGKIKARNLLIIVLSILFIVKNTVAEGRIESLQMLLLLFILYVDHKKISNLFFSLGSIVGYLVMTIFADIRVSTGTISLFKTGQDGSRFLQSNQGDVFYNSAVYIGLIKEQVFSDMVRSRSFIGFIERIFLPSKFATGGANLSSLSAQYAQSGGGGLISTYFYVWLSYAGTILIAIFLAILFNRVYRAKNQYLQFYLVMVLCTIPRWFAYDPITLFKLTSYGVVFFFCFNQLHTIVGKTSKSVIGLPPKLASRADR
ncbi:hypothetical protein ACFOLF_10680 [Paenibacillus sepulcri]|uniref:O-antigen polysaccharide polymerase Wzy n=1 Tax=Paenibacillus sepulcri TaxID=359917 RepID=A0ABS7C1D3_9BACL|nr:hypothetical protein [Paenibacillus sepulcri]